MQFYGQDTIAGLGASPYDFAGHADALQIPKAENFIFGTQLGNLALFGYSGAHEWDATRPHVEAFCKFVGETSSVHAVLVLGHWNEANLGCRPGMDVPSVYEKMKAMGGCGVKRMLYFMGHEHCNVAMPSAKGPLDAVGFLIGGAGMFGNGCSQFGFTVIHSDPSTESGPDVRVEYFPIAEHEIVTGPLGKKKLGKMTDRFDGLFHCLNRSGYEGCRSQHGQSFRATSVTSIVTPMTMNDAATSSTKSNTMTRTLTSTTVASTMTSTSTAATAGSTGVFVFSHSTVTPSRGIGDAGEVFDAAAAALVAALPARARPDIGKSTITTTTTTTRAVFLANPPNYIIFTGACGLALTGGILLIIFLRSQSQARSKWLGHDGYDTLDQDTLLRAAREADLSIARAREATRKEAEAWSERRKSGVQNATTRSPRPDATGGVRSGEGAHSIGGHSGRSAGNTTDGEPERHLAPGVAGSRPDAQEVQGLSETALRAPPREPGSEPSAGVREPKASRSETVREPASRPRDAAGGDGSRGSGGAAASSTSAPAPAPNRKGGDGSKGSGGASAASSSAPTPAPNRRGEPALSLPVEKEEADMEQQAPHTAASPDSRRQGRRWLAPRGPAPAAQEAGSPAGGQGATKRGWLPKLRKR